MSKVGLVLEGGAMRGMYTACALDNDLKLLKFEITRQKVDRMQ